MEKLKKALKNLIQINNPLPDRVSQRECEEHENLLCVRLQTVTYSITADLLLCLFGPIMEEERGGKMGSLKYATVVLLAFLLCDK